ncbi:F-box/kelch-repeat protein SKIP11-like protein [Tanacetum coccineum]|uniref:F-box/kelch-repeat protein SKIP11-like protein n=1 Tax=Tanacetum coccineum TaxID=301880 RepID=A0ABQ5BMM6_9ASTR
MKNHANGTLHTAKIISKENRSRSTTSVWKVRVEPPEEYPFSSASSAFTAKILPSKSSFPSDILCNISTLSRTGSQLGNMQLESDNGLEMENCTNYSINSMAAGTELLILGKDVFGPAICKYSVLTNTWSLGKKMNTPRSRIVERYASKTGAWEMLPSLLKSGKMSSGVMMHGELYVIGSSEKTRRRYCLAMKVKNYNKVKSIWVNIGKLPERANSMGRWGISFIHGMWGYKGTPS